MSISTDQYHLSLIPFNEIKYPALICTVTLRKLWCKLTSNFTVLTDNGYLAILLSAADQNFDDIMVKNNLNYG